MHLCNYVLDLKETVWEISKQLCQRIFDTFQSSCYNRILFMAQDKRSFTKTNSMATIVWAKILSLHSIKLHAKNQSFCVFIYLFYFILCIYRKWSNNGIMVEFLLWYMPIAIDRDSPSHWIFLECATPTPHSPQKQYQY